MPNILSDSRNRLLRSTLLLLMAVAFFLVLAPQVQACAITCHGDYYPAGSPGAVARTGGYDAGVCVGSVSISGCEGGGDEPSGGGGGFGGGGGGGGLPDLTTSGITPTMSEAGVPNTFSASVTNGTAWYAGESVTRFERATSASGTGVTTVDTVSTGALSGSASRTVSVSYTHPMAGTFYMRACADSGNAVTETNEANNCGAWTLISVSAPVVLMPDLIAGSASAPGASRGSTVTVSAPIQNTGNAGAAASRAYYELTAPSSKANTSGVVALSSIAASGSQTASFSYTFSSSGNYAIRFCADWWGEVAESNEGNNCGPWTDIAIPEGPVDSSVSCQVSSQSVTTGQSVTYTAIPVAAATSPYTWTPSDGVGNYGTNSTATRTFTSPGSYGMQVRATNAAAAANCPVVTVGAGYCVSGTPALTLTANPTRVRQNQSTTLTWSASNVPGQGATCTLSGPGVNVTRTVSDAPACSAGDSHTVTVTTQSTYVLQCGSARESVVVNVIPEFEEF